MQDWTLLMWGCDSAIRPGMAGCCRALRSSFKRIQLYAMQGKGHEVKNKLRNDLKPTVIANWKLWVPAQFINFRMVPPHLQVSYILPYPMP